MKRIKIPLYDISLPKAALKEVRQTLQGGWLSTGKQVEQFEHRIAELCGCKYAAAMNSATSGLVAAMKAAGVNGGEVVTTPFSFVATAEAVFHCGAKPVFADIDPETLNIDPAQVARKVSRRTSCILPVDMAGCPADYGRLTKIAREHKLPVIADSSHSLAATYRGRSIPQLANAAVFSFHATKNLTCGEGGMVVSRSKRLIEEVRLLSRHGITASSWQRKKKGARAYDVCRLGQKGNMSEVHASIGLGGLETFSKDQDRRQRLFERYNKNLSDLTDFVTVPLSESHLQPSWHLYIVRLTLSRLKINRDRFIELMAEKGVECGVHFIPIPLFSFYRRMGYSLKDLSVTRQVSKEIVTLPMYAALKPGDVDRVCETMAGLFIKYGR